MASYLVGYLVSVVATFAIFFSVMNHTLSGTSLIVLAVTLGVAQLLVQLFLFLHVGQEQKLRWRAVALIFALIVVGIIVAGTLWIMHNLNTYMMPTTNQMEQYMQDQEG